MSEGIKEIKEKMVNYVDFYGGEFLDHEAILKAKTKKELEKIAMSHLQFLELQHGDAMTHTEDFIHGIFK